MLTSHCVDIFRQIRVVASLFGRVARVWSWTVFKAGAVCVFTGVGISLPVSALALSMPASPDIARDLSTAQVRWHGLQSLTASGIPMHIMPFSSAHKPLVVAQSLSRAGPVFQRILTTPRQIVLSGLDADWHWMATIAPHHSGAQGYVSLLYLHSDMSLTDSSDKNHSLSDHHLWLPQQAFKVFDHSSRVNDMRVHQYGYTVGMPISSLYKDMGKKLSDRGWRPIESGGHSSQQWHWRLGNEQITVYASPSGNGTLLLLQHMTAG